MLRTPFACARFCSGIIVVSRFSPGGTWGRVMLIGFMPWFSNIAEKHRWHFLLPG